MNNGYNQYHSQDAAQSHATQQDYYYPQYQQKSKNTNTTLLPLAATIVSGLAIAAAIAKRNTKAAKQLEKNVNNSQVSKKGFRLFKKKNKPNQTQTASQTSVQPKPQKRLWKKLTGIFEKKNKTQTTSQTPTQSNIPEKMSRFDKCWDKCVATPLTNLIYWPLVWPVEQICKGVKHVAKHTHKVPQTPTQQNTTKKGFLNTQFNKLKSIKLFNRKNKPQTQIPAQPKPAEEPKKGLLSRFSVGKWLSKSKNQSQTGISTERAAERAARKQACDEHIAKQTAAINTTNMAKKAEAAKEAQIQEIYDTGKKAILDAIKKAKAEGKTLEQITEITGKIEAEFTAKAEAIK